MEKYKSSVSGLVKDRNNNEDHGCRRRRDALNFPGS